MNSTYLTLDNNSRVIFYTLYLEQLYGTQLCPPSCNYTLIFALWSDRPSFKIPFYLAIFKYLWHLSPSKPHLE